MFKLSLCLVTLFAACYAQSIWDSLTQYNCRRIQAADCYSYGYHPECGTDGKTYRNRCDFSKAHCEDPNLHVYAYTACENITFPGAGQTTSAPQISGQEAIMDTLCIEISHTTCGTEKEIVCGSDLRDYDNLCEFQKAKCTHRELHILFDGSCVSPA